MILAIRTELSTRAARELRFIYLESARLFGRQQADIYIDSLLGTMTALGNFPESGRALNASGDVRVAPSGSHRLIYKIESRCVRVLRIVHNRQLQPEI
ncbi:type II toxin-antitoxin system RelE/ParE family toxin [Hyphobacterium indicum]|uniref:type II toxin-antitoxin system RelE/ParE family toxin n=1 Tax=Hyphobacterium indicum TaxID=2162714 RepID=UPI002D7951D1|nr:type II toxin-antitoxin system RelE/ParE family toxin [Hyphobacterium indicum]